MRGTGRAHAGDERRARVVGERRGRVAGCGVERALDLAPAAARRPASGSRKSPSDSNSRDRVARRCRAADGSRRSPPAGAGRCDRAVRCAARRPTASTADRTARGAGRTRSCGLRRPPRWRRAGWARRRRGTGPLRCRGARGDSSSWKTPCGELGALAERRAQHLERLAVRDEHERLLRAPRASAVPAPAATRAADPSASIACGLRPRSCAFVGPEHGRERGARRERAADAVPLLAPGDGPRRPAASHRGSTARAAGHRRSRRPTSIGHADRAAAGRRCPRDASSWCTAAAACPTRAAPRSSIFRKLLGAQQLQQPEEAVRVVFERRGAEQQHVTAQRGNRRDRAPRRLAGMPGGRRRRCASSTTSRSMPAATACAVSCGSAVSVSRAITARRCTSNGLKPAPKSRVHVGQPRLVEQREHLVILAPQLAEPLHGQRVGRHHQAALDAARVHEAVRESGTPRSVLPRPTSSASSQRTGSAAGRALGDVELVREQADAPAEERPEAVGFAHATADAGRRAGSGSRRASSTIARGQPLEQGAMERGAAALAVDRHERIRCSRPAAAVVLALGNPDDDRGLRAR